MITLAAVRKLALALPAVEESTSYGTPALKVRGKLMARLKEDGETLVLRATGKSANGCSSCIRPRTS